MNNDNTLFFVSYEGERHEDHLPWQICPLSKIKNYVDNDTYQKLLVTKHWVCRENWFDTDRMTLLEHKRTLEDIRTGKNTNENDYNDFLGDGIFVVNFHPVVLDQNNCAYFPIS